MARDVERQTKIEERKPPKQERAPAEAPEQKPGGARRKRAAPRVATEEHAVFLVPGLLGFERFATFSYFADRVVAALRAGLEQAMGQPVSVVAVPIPPTASLRERQMKLVRTLCDRLHALEHDGKPLQVHLVGHSTGGVDAILLTQLEPIGGGVWSDLDPRAPELRARIRSVVTIGSPHQGACITADPIAKLVGRRDLRGVPAFANLFGKFALSVMSDVELTEFALSAKREATKTYRFFTDVVSRWRLIADLQPTRLPNTAQLKSDVVRRCFVTVPGNPKPGVVSASHADAFFRAITQRASGWDTGSAEQGDLVPASVTRLRQALASDQAEDLLIKAPGVELPAELDAGHNDGVVNSARQLLDPSDPNELAGLVVGDHFDVVGYYDRHVWTMDEQGHEQPKQVVSGLLHSGCNFRDRQFFELYRRVANTIAAVAR